MTLIQKSGQKLMHLSTGNDLRIALLTLFIHLNLFFNLTGTSDIDWSQKKELRAFFGLMYMYLMGSWDDNIANRSMDCQRAGVVSNVSCWYNFSKECDLFDVHCNMTGILWPFYFIEPGWNIVIMFHFEGHCEVSKMLRQKRSAYIFYD